MSGQLRGAPALEALEAAGKLWATPAQAADVLERGEIPNNRVGQRYNVPVAWLRRQADGVTA